MRVALTLAALVALGLLGPTDAVCYLKNEDTAVCHKVDDVELIDAQNLTTLKTSVYHKVLGSFALKDLSANLKSLDLSEGDIQLIESGTFAKLTGLRDLKLSDNSIVKLEDSALKGLEKLKNLDLRRNEIRQLPPALKKLIGLKNLEISGNPLVCNCATLRVRDDLLSSGVKISSKVFCSSPKNLKGVSILEPEAEVICMFEEQDNEMQADQADPGSGDFEDGGEVPTEAPVVPIFHASDQTNNDPEIITDDLIIPVLSRNAAPESSAGTSVEATSESGLSNSSASSVDGDSPTHLDDFEFTPVVNGIGDDLIVEGSGRAEDPEEEGSGIEGSGGKWDYLDSEDSATAAVEEKEITSTTTEPATPSTMSWFDVLFGAVSTTEIYKEEPETVDPDIDNVDQEETTTTTTTTTTARSSFIDRGIINPNIGVTEETIVTKKVQDVDATSPTVTKSGKYVEDFSSASGTNDTAINDLGKASTTESQKSMGSYIVLAALLGVLAALVVFAAYRSGFCKKKPSGDVERGTELKDVKKSLLDPTNTPQPRIASNGNMENVPLVAPATDAWSSPQESRQWPSQTNGTKQPTDVESEPVKPPRKSLPPQEDANVIQEVKTQTQAPMSTFAPRTNGSQGISVTPPNSPSAGSYDGKHSPPLSPNAQRVKITMQDNPDSIPKTPILITRTKPGVNLVKTP